MKKQTLALWLIGLLPLMLLLTGIASGAWKEYRAWNELQPVLNDVFFGRPKASANVERTTLANETERQNLATIFSSLKQEGVRDEIIGPYGQWLLVDPKTTWDTAPLYARLAKKAMPAIDQLETLDNQTRSNGTFSPQMEHFREDANAVLQIALIDAFYRSDFDEAYRLINVLANRIALLPIDNAANVQSEALREQFILYSLIQDSLQYDPWTQSQLVGLAKLIEQPVDLKQRLETGRRHQDSQIIGNTLLAYDDRLQREAKDGKSPWHPTNGAVCLKNVIDAAKSDSGISGITDYSQIYQALQKESKPIIAGGVFNPAMIYWRANRYWISDNLRHLVGKIATTENMRRMTLTALDIKRYQKRTGQWPTDLSDLDLDQQSPSWTKTVDGTLFTYKVNENASVKYAVLDIEGDYFLESSTATITNWQSRFSTSVALQLIHTVRIR